MKVGGGNLVFEMLCLKNVCGIRRSDRMRNTIIERTGELRLSAKNEG